MPLILNRWGGEMPVEEKKMKTCRKCGHEIQDDFNVCPYCGSRQDNKITCQNCGAIVEDDVAFCPRCGKSPRVKNNAPTVRPFSYRYYDDKPIRGTAFGVLLTMFFSLLGFILVFILGDEDAKRGAKITLIVVLCLSVIILVAYLIVICVILS